MYVEKRINELEGRWVQGVGARSLCGKVEESVKYVLRPANRHPSPWREDSHWSAGKELSNVIAQSPLQLRRKIFLLVLFRAWLAAVFLYSFAAFKVAMPRILRIK
jgi:hypothetical protein